MSRRALSILVGVVGTIIAGLTLLLLLVMGSVFADARSENMVGPGVDIFVRTPFPTVRGKIVLDVEARGGSRAGIKTIAVNAYLAESSWPQVAVKNGRGLRGSDTETVSFRAPGSVNAEETLPLFITVSYVVAMQRGDTYNHETRHDVVKLGMKVYSSSGRLWAQLSRVLLAFGCFLMWFFVVWGVAKLYAKAGPDEVGTHNAELEGIGLLMGFMGGSVLGYWLFAWRIMNALELSSTWWAVLLMIFWGASPLLFVWWWWKRRGTSSGSSKLPSARVVAR